MIVILYPSRVSNITPIILKVRAYYFYLYNMIIDEINEKNLSVDSATIKGLNIKS